MDKLTFPAVILAGGKSSRMKRDKSLLPFGNYSTLCEYQYRKLEKLFSTIYISTKEDKFSFVQDKSTLLLDNTQDHSPMIALQSILKQTQSEYCFITTVDIPLLEDATIMTMAKHFVNSDFDVIIAQDNLGNTHNLCGIFRISLLPLIEKLLEKDIHKINTIIKQSKSKIITFDNPLQFTNVNTPQEYQEVLHSL